MCSPPSRPRALSTAAPSPAAPSARVTVLFEGSAKTLLLLHAVLGFGALFSATHHSAHAILAARGVRQQTALVRFGWIAPAFMISQALCGLALYPVYRVRVRA